MVTCPIVIKLDLKFILYPPKTLYKLITSTLFYWYQIQDLSKFNNYKFINHWTLIMH